MHYLLYADDGTGVPALRIVGEAAFMIGTLGLMFCLFALAKGWNITTSKLNNKKCPETQTARARTRTRAHTCIARGGLAALHIACRNARPWSPLHQVARSCHRRAVGDVHVPFCCRGRRRQGGGAVQVRVDSRADHPRAQPGILTISLPLTSILTTLNTTLNTILTTLNFDSHYLNTIITTVNQTTDALDAISRTLN